MSKSIIALSSVNYAIKGERYLKGKGVNCNIVKLQPTETKKGCAYGLEINRIDLSVAAALLNNAGIPYTEIVR